MRDYSKDFAEWRKWRDEKGLPPIYDNPADAGIETDFRVGSRCRSRMNTACGSNRT